MERDSQMKRTDEIRQRRKQASSAPAQRMARRKRSLPQPPPVLVRGDRSEQSMAGKGRSSARRRYDVALGIPGAELRLPALPQVHLTWRYLSGLMVVMIAICLYYMWNSPLYRVAGVELVGAQRLTSSELNAVLGIEGKTVFEIDRNSLLSGLQKAFPELYNLSIQITIPAQVVVSAQERQPVLVWQQAGRTYWVDAEGVAFPARSEENLSVRVNADNLPSNAFNLDQASTLPVFDVAFIASILQVRGIAPAEADLVFDAERGLGWQDPRGWQTFVGNDLQDIGMKLSVYQAIVDHLTSQNIQPTLVSVEHLHAPYYRLTP